MQTSQNQHKSTPQEHWIKVEGRDLVLGMFVIELDRPWRETPFPINGFHLRKFDQIQSVRMLCQWVYIDPGKGASPRKREPRKLTILTSARQRAPESLALKVRHDAYPRSRAVKQEIDNARLLFERLDARLVAAIDAVRAHKPIGVQELYGLTNETIDCVLRNPDGFIWFLNTGEQGNCLLKHSIRAAVWAIVFACNVGFGRDEIEALFIGTLLCDIGMAKLPEELVSRAGPFTRAEYLAYRRHVELGVDALNAEADLDPRIASIVRGHHERHDGLGFPRRQRGDQIPMLARVANLAYSYERMLKRSSQADLSPATAISRLYKQRKLKFADQLVYEFIKALGMFPAGSIVELASGEIGIVTEQNPNQRLTPRISVLTTPRKQLLERFQQINQGEQKDHERVKPIARCLPRGSFGIDPANFTERLFGRRIGFGPLAIRF